MKKMSVRIGLIAAGAGIVLTFFFTLGKIIEPSVRLFRFILNGAVFFVLGFALVLVYEKYVRPLLDNASLQNTDEKASASPESDKGKNLDLSEAVPSETGAEADPISGTVDLPDSPPASGAAADGDPAGSAPAKPPSPYSAAKDFKVQDGYIYIKDKRMPNDPKMLAEAIKTKMAE